MEVFRSLLVLTLAVAATALTPALVWSQDETGDEWPEDPWAEPERAAIEFHGFVETGLGTRLQDDPEASQEETLGEMRFRAELARDVGRVELSLKADLVADAVGPEEIDLDLREALLSFSAGDADFWFGRQVLTWGTGDLLFLNDLFPKDWISFFAGRETSYLKAPSDSLKLSLFKSALNLDVVWTPIFEPDRFLTGERFTYYSPIAGGIVGAPPELDPVEPPRTFENGELAVRLYRRVASKELALYGYRGFFKQPKGFDPALGRAVFPPLSVFGASLRAPLWGGIGNAEVAWHDSRDDRSGDDPLVPNSQLRLLLGHERELVRRLTLGLQYYLEGIQHHDRLLESLPPGQRSAAPERLRHVLTTRWTHRSRQDVLTLSLFVFWSPSDEDWFAMPSADWRINDRWHFALGLNVLGGAQPHTFFAQLENNSNAYARLRLSF